MLSYIFVIMLFLSVVFGILNGRMAEVSAAALEGAGAAVTLCIGIVGAMCLWSGVMEVMTQAGLAKRLSRLVTPLIGRLFPGVRHNSGVMSLIGANLTANFLGLGNAATPLGIRAAKGIADENCARGLASNDLCMLAVVNASSIQLIPVTVIAVRAGLGAANPFDILPAVWASSLAGLFAGILTARLCERAFAPQSIRGGASIWNASRRCSSR